MIKEQRYSLVEHLNSLFAAIPKIWSQGLLGGALFMLPGSLAIAAAFMSMDLQGLFNNSSDPMAMLNSMMPYFILTLVASLLTGAGGAALQTHMLLRAEQLRHSDDPAPALRFDNTFIHYFKPVLIYNLLVGLMITGFMLLGIILGSLAMIPFIVTAAGSAGPALIAGILLGYFVMFVTMIVPMFWISTRYAVAAPACIRDNAGAVAAMKKSVGLVKGQFWRTLGISLVVSMVVSMISSMLSGPFMAIGYIPYFQAVATMSSGMSGIAELGEAIRSMTLFIAIASYLQAIINGALLPVFQVQLLADLQARKLPPAPLDPAQPVSYDQL